MAQFTSRFVQANGIRIHYVREGRGPPLLLLHGWPEFWLVWRKCIPDLARDFDVIAPDLRGFGDSEKPAPHLPQQRLPMSMPPTCWRSWMCSASPKPESSRMMSVPMSRKVWRDNIASA